MIVYTVFHSDISTCAIGLPVGQIRANSREEAMRDGEFQFPAPARHRVFVRESSHAGATIPTDNGQQTTDN